MKIKTNELERIMLDYAVAKCLGHEVVENYVSYIRIYLTDPKQAGYALTFCPSTDWAHGGPIIERERITVIAMPNGTWATSSPCHSFHHPTPLIAAMRCYVASKLGDEVEVPDELLT